MKIVGGPRNGQEVTITKPECGHEVRVPGMVLEYAFTSPGSVQIKMSMDLEPKPSIPGLIERYVCRDEAWHYIPPSSPTGFMITPPVPVA
jgi:hypothetical protein